jgi:hypothetical protein
MLRTPDGLCCDWGQALLIGVAGLRRGGIAVVPGVPLAAARCPLRLPFHVGPQQGLVLAILLIDPRGRVEDHRPTLNRVNDRVSLEANSAIRLVVRRSEADGQV